jgi:hypothetical protein
MSIDERAEELDKAPCRHCIFAGRSSRNVGWCKKGTEDMAWDWPRVENWPNLKNCPKEAERGSNGY